jgi:hypothetical protein
MKRQISFSLIFITLSLVTSVAGAQVRISKADMKTINKANLGKGCWISYGREGVISNWGSDARVLKMRYETADFTMAVACGKPKVILDSEFRDLITVRIQNEGAWPGDRHYLTRIVFDWKVKKNPAGRKISIKVETTTGKKFNLILKTGSSSRSATLTALAAIKTAENAEQLAEKAYGGVEYRNGGRGIKLSLGGFWAFNTPGEKGYGSYLSILAKVKTLSPKAYMSISGALSWQQYELYIISAPDVQNSTVLSSNTDIMMKANLHFLLGERAELFAGLGFGGRSFGHQSAIGGQDENAFLSFTHANTSFKVLFGAEIGVNVWLNSIFGLNFFYRFDMTLNKQTIKPSSFESVSSKKDNAFNHSLVFGLIFRI